MNKVLAELSRGEVMRIIAGMEEEMASASESMDFEEVAQTRGLSRELFAANNACEIARC